MNLWNNQQAIFLLTLFFFLNLFFPEIQEQENINFRDKVFLFLKNKEEKGLIILQSTHSTFTYNIERRKNYIWSKKVSIANVDNKKTRVDIYFYQYQDTVLSNKDYLSFLKCFPTDCVKIIKGENRKAFKTIPSIVIKNPKSIVIAVTGCNSKNTQLWTEIREELFDKFSCDLSEVFTTECGGKLKWMKK
jgi:hypothetical protein